MNCSQPPILPRRGFTLIEILVVVGIVVLLIGILIPTLSHVISQAKSTTASSQLRQISMACDTYNQDFRAYPGLIRETGWRSANATTSVDRSNPSVTTTSVFTSSQSLYASLNLRTLNGSTGSGIAANNPNLTASQVKLLFNSTTTIPSADWVDVTLASGDPITTPAAPTRISIGLDPRDKPIDKATGKEFGAYLATKPADTSDAITRTVSGKLVPVFDAPCFVDSAYKSQALPILYYRQDGKPTKASTDAGTVTLVEENATAAKRAAYYRNANSAFDEYTLGKSREDEYPQLGQSDINKFNADDDGNTPRGHILTRSVSQKVSGFDVPKGGYVLISAGSDRKYGTKDDIIVSNGSN